MLLFFVYMIGDNRLPSQLLQLEKILYNFVYVAFVVRARIRN